MRSKTGLLILLSCLLLWWGCEKDDICPENTPKTPTATLNFYTVLDGAPQPATLANVTVYGLQGSTRLTEIASDQKRVALPLNFETEKSDFLVLYARKEPLDTLRDTIKFAYKPELVFISKACGFRYIYRNVEISSTSNSIDKVVNLLIPEPYNSDLLTSKVSTGNIYFKTNP